MHQMIMLGQVQFKWWTPTRWCLVRQNMRRKFLSIPFLSVSLFSAVSIQPTMQARINRRQGRPIQDLSQKAWWGSQQRHASTGDFESKSLPERRTRDGKVAERKTKGILQRRHPCVRWGTAVDDSALRHGGASAAIKALRLALCASVLLLLLFPEFECCTEHMNTCTHADKRTTTRARPGRNKINCLCELETRSDWQAFLATIPTNGTVLSPQPEMIVWSFLSSAWGAHSFCITGFGAFPYNIRTEKRQTRAALGFCALWRFN